MTPSQRQLPTLLNRQKTKSKQFQHSRSSIAVPNYFETAINASICNIPHLTLVLRPRAKWPRLRPLHAISNAFQVQRGDSNLGQAVVRAEPDHKLPNTPPIKSQ
ncbi:hypothetical protein MTP99_001955 [Tenebrio molitor]|nr:hypothetical protein MTP99_001955 [Tenebrio molitor]